MHFGICPFQRLKIFKYSIQVGFWSQLTAFTAKMFSELLRVLSASAELFNWNWFYLSPCDTESSV